MKEDKLAVSEIFGPTYQGEGKHLGYPVMFLRLAGCNLSCVWCDTPYTWDWKNYNKKDEITMMDVHLVAELIIDNAGKVKHLVITGGEPLLQSKPLGKLIYYLRLNGFYIEIETAGSIIPKHTVSADLYTVSPKLENSGNALKKRYNEDAFDWFNKRLSVYKFVVQDLADFKEIDKMVRKHKLKDVYIMQEGKTKKEVSNTDKQVWEYALKKGYKLTTRLHVIYHGQKRKV